MKWHHVQENWAAFYEAIIDKWPEAEDTELDEIDGDQRAFIDDGTPRYIHNRTFGAQRFEYGFVDQVMGLRAADGGHHEKVCPGRQGR